MASVSTKTRPPAEVVGLDHLHLHPQLVPLFEHRSQLHERKRAIEADVLIQNRALNALPDDGSFGANVARRTAVDALADLERRAVEVEAELRAIEAELETTRDAVKAQLIPVMAAEGLPVTAELLDAFERLAEVGTRFAAFGQRSRCLLGTPLASLPWASVSLAACIKQVQRIRERLQRLSEQ